MSVWDVVFCRFTVASLLLALAAHGRELISAARRVGFTGFASLMATLFLMAIKSEHLGACPQFRRGFHLNSTAAVNTSALSPAERTWFMTEMLPAFRQVVHEPYDTIRLADELDSHATAMFGALQTRVDDIWGEQAGKTPRVFVSLLSTKQPKGEEATNLDVCINGRASHADGATHRVRWGIRDRAGHV